MIKNFGVCFFKLAPATTAGMLVRLSVVVGGEEVTRRVAKGRLKDLSLAFMLLILVLVTMRIDER